MEEIPRELIARLNHPKDRERIEVARELGRYLKDAHYTPVSTEEVNNHVHTSFSFSPYSPAMAAWKARAAGLKAVGIMDHDTVAGCEEMLEAARELDFERAAVLRDKIEELEKEKKK